MHDLHAIISSNCRVTGQLVFCIQRIVQNTWHYSQVIRVESCWFMCLLYAEEPDNNYTQNWVSLEVLLRLVVTVNVMCRTYHVKYRSFKALTSSGRRERGCVVSG